MPRRPLTGFAAALAGLEHYLNERNLAFGPITAEAADLRPLLWALPYGPILATTSLGRDSLGSYISLVLRNRRPHARRHEPHTEATPRLLDPEAFAFLCALLLSGDTVFIDTDSPASTPEHQRHDYIEVFGKGGITLLRILANAKPGQAVNEAPDHHDLRRGFLSLGSTAAQAAAGKRTQGSYRTREHAIGYALDNFARAEAEGRLPVPITRSQYERLLRAFARLLDERSLGAFLPDHRPPRTPQQEHLAFALAEHRATHPGDETTRN